MRDSFETGDVQASGYFGSAEEALKWAVEVLRRRRLPKSQGFWREMEAEAEFVAASWEGEKNLRLPADGQERLLLALKVMDALESVAGVDGDVAGLLKLWAWGDWADEGRLRVALAIQEKCRREGVRVRICYRYTYEQLAAMKGCDRKTIWRKVRGGFELLEKALVKRGVMVRFEVPRRETDDFKKMFYYHDFKNIN